MNNIEFIKHKMFLDGFNEVVSILGSSVNLSERIIDFINSISSFVCNKKIPIMTGGGDGIMLAINKSVMLGNGLSIGIVYYKEKYNKWLDIKLSISEYFVRQLLFCYCSNIYIVFPGGIGTLTELLNIFTMCNVDNINNKRILLIDSSYWVNVLNIFSFMRDKQYIANDCKINYEIIDHENDLIKKLVTVL